MTTLSALERVRRTLDSLGYREPLPPDGLPLVTRILDDLINASKGLKTTTEELAQVKKKCDDASASVVPYQEENGRLLTQLNTLHMENINLREQNEKHAKELQNVLQKLEEENQDLRFIVGEYQRKIEDLESESRKKTEKILQLQEKNLKAVVSTPGGRKKQIPFHRQRLEITSHLPEKIMSSCNKCSKCGCAGAGQFPNNNDAYLADLLRMTDQKLQDLQHEVECSRRQAKENENQCNMLKKQIANREAEIGRLQGLLEGGRSVAAIIEDNRLQAAHAHLHQLQLHNDMLTKTNIHLEGKLKNILGDTHEAMNRAVKLADENTDLTNELENIEKTTRMLEEDAANTAETLTQRLEDAREKLLACEADLAEQHRLFHLMRDERDRLYKELVQLRHNHSRLSHDHTRLVTERVPMMDENRKMEDLLKKGQEEKKTLVDKINHLTVSLEEAETEKLRLSVDGESLRQTIKELTEQKEAAEQGKEFYIGETEKLQAQNRELEQERDYYKEESHKTTMLKADMEQERDYYKDQTGELLREKQGIEQAKDFMSDDVRKLQAQVKQLQLERNYFSDQLSETQGERVKAEREREYYSDQVNQLLDILKTKPSSTPSSPLQIGKRGKPLSPDTELARVIHERDVLKQERNFFKMQFQSLKSQQGTLVNGSGGSVASGPTSGPAAVVPGVVSPPSTGVIPGGPPGAAAPSGTPPPRPQSVPTGAVDVETIRRERDFFKQQMEYFRQQYNNQLTRAPPLSATRSMDQDRGPRPPLTRTSSEASPRLEGDSRVIQQERDFFRQQYEALKASLAQPVVPPGSGDEAVDISNVLREKDMLQQERDFFRSQYNDLSRKMAQTAVATPTVSQAIRQEMESLLAEKRGMAISKADLEAQVKNLTERLIDVEQEKKAIDNHTRELHSAIEKLQDAATSKFPPSTQAFIMEVRKARDAALSDVDKLKKEREALREKLRDATSHQMREKATYDEEASNLRLQNEEGRRMATDLQQRLQSESILIASLQDQVQSLQEALQLAHGELGLQGKQSDDIKRLLEQKVGQIGDTEQQLEFHLNQLSMSEARVKDLEGQLSRLSQELAESRATGSAMRNNVTRLDHDKDLLTAELDTKTEQLGNLRDELRKKEAQIAHLEGNITKLQGKLDAALSAVSAEERRYQGEERRSQRLEQDLAAITIVRDNANKEILRLQKEVAGLMESYKNLREELEKCQTSKDNFKRKAQEYCRTLEEMTHLMASKDSEQSSLKKQYLNLNEAVSSLKSLNASLEESITAREQELTKMEEMVAKFKEDREQIIGQMMEASQKCDALEESCHKLEEAKYNVEKDLINTRELVQKLDMKKGQAEGEVARLTGTLEQVLSQKRALEQRFEALSSQLNGERSTVRSMEEMLNEKRRAEWSSEATMKQLEVEKNQLQRKISEVQQQLDDETSECKRLRSRVVQLESDVERFRRDLTEERFERERASQELRRVQKYQYINSALDAIGSVSVATSEGPRHPTKIASPPSASVVATEGAVKPAKPASVTSPPVGPQVGQRPPAQVESPSEPQPISGSRVPSRSETSQSVSQEASNIERHDSFSKAHATAVHSSSSDTGLERSQAISSSSDSHTEPWRLAFGSNASQLHRKAASLDSVQKSPAAYSRVTHGSRSDLRSSARSPKVHEQSAASLTRGPYAYISQRVPSAHSQASSSSHFQTPVESSHGRETEGQEAVPSVRPKESRPRLSKHGTSGESDSWG
ncbi:centrosomal protein of 135 kDa-like isoform X1 [Macrobrachium rosenbergii]|uniref:centrosomal protein of 135 kDa-like isoform X1 n=2 Tax=Macrobrachium rosenbergii TaxID=79674 RepID=UPI0034D40F22